MSDEDEEEKEGEGGEGKDIYPYGEYEGGRDSNLDRHGFGSALLPTGDVYEGWYIRGKRDGLGMYVFKNGARYIGEWRKGMKHGQGTFWYPDGTKYVGHWRKDNKHGSGTYYYANGDTYEGSWFKNQRFGLGTYIYKSVGVVYYGIWKYGIMDGPGVLKYASYRYHGRFEKNLPKGPGCFVFDGRYMQHGFYVNMRDPAFDYVGAQELELEKNEDVPVVVPEIRGNPPGIVPIWRARHITEFKEELLPPEPVEILPKDSEDTMIDIIDYLQKQYGERGALGAEADEEHMQTTSPVPYDLVLPEPADQAD